jgi:Cellulase (glycosyl hydrolase family 5)
VIPIVPPLVAALVGGALVLTGPIAFASGDSDAEGEPPGLVIGVVPQRDFEAADTALMRAAGIDSVRIWFSWGQVEERRGDYYWAQLDFVVAAAARDEIGVLPFLFSGPRWAASEDGYPCGDRCPTYAPASAETREAFADFASAAVRRYGPDGSFWDDYPELPYRPIRSWQVWNEQNSKFFYRPAANARSYAELLRRTAERIRAVDPNAEIVLGGMWSAEDRPDGVIGSPRYLRQLYRVDGIEDSFDSIAVHPYAPRIRDVFAQVKGVRRVASRAGDPGVGLWVTELGWASSGKRSEALVTDPEMQARLLERAFSRLVRNRARYHLRGAYWYAWRDTERGEAVCAWCAYSGLISRQGNLKPAYDAMRTLSLARGRLARASAP